MDGMVTDAACAVGFVVTHHNATISMGRVWTDVRAASSEIIVLGVSVHFPFNI
jgi:hypothetical protein